MKKLYVRFFKHSTDEIPWDSYLVCVDNCGTRETIKSIEDQAYNMATFFTAHPEGKVDFVWLPME